MGKLNKSANDVENCSNASLYFGKVLQTKREEKVVLPKVLTLLGKRYAKSSNIDQAYKDTDFESIPWKKRSVSFPHPMAGFWKCRLISKIWNKVIEGINIPVILFVYYR